MLTTLAHFFMTSILIFFLKFSSQTRIIARTFLKLTWPPELDSAVCVACRRPLAVRSEGESPPEPPHQDLFQSGSSIHPDLHTAKTMRRT